MSCGIPGGAWGWPGQVGAAAVRRGTQARLCAHPGPHWAPVAVAVAAGVLVVSCVLCVLCCCCHRRRRTEPRDKEAVGLGRALSATTTHRVSCGRSPAPGQLGPRGQLRGPVRPGGQRGARAGWSAQTQRKPKARGTGRQGRRGRWHQGLRPAPRVGPAPRVTRWSLGRQQCPGGAGQGPSSAWAAAVSPSARVVSPESRNRRQEARGVMEAGSQHTRPRPRPPRCSRRWTMCSPARGNPSSGGACSCPCSTTWGASR